MHRRVICEAIRGKTARNAEIRASACDDIQHQGGGDGANYLGHDVRKYFADREPLADIEPYGDRGIEMSAGDMADGKSHRQHGEAKCQSNAGEGDTKLGKTSRQHCAAASPED